MSKTLKFKTQLRVKTTSMKENPNGLRNDIEHIIFVGNIFKKF